MVTKIAFETDENGPHRVWVAGAVTPPGAVHQAGFFPIATDVHVRYGHPVDVGPREDDPSDAKFLSSFAKFLSFYELN